MIKNENISLKIINTICKLSKLIKILYYLINYSINIYSLPYYFKYYRNMISYYVTSDFHIIIKYYISYYVAYDFHIILNIIINN